LQEKANEKADETGQEKEKLYKKMIESVANFEEARILIYTN
jgi:hypothetical protein